MGCEVSHLGPILTESEVTITAAKAGFNCTNFYRENWAWTEWDGPLLGMRPGLRLQREPQLEGILRSEACMWLRATALPLCEQKGGAPQVSSTSHQQQLTLSCKEAAGSQRLCIFG